MPHPAPDIALGNAIGHSHIPLRAAAAARRRYYRPGAPTGRFGAYTIICGRLDR